MAATSPAAVAMSASAIPGATTASEADPTLPIPMKEFMIPHTVPKRPIKGVVDPVVARKVRYLSSLAASVASTLFSVLFILSISVSSEEWTALKRFARGLRLILLVE